MFPPLFDSLGLIHISFLVIIHNVVFLIITDFSCGGFVDFHFSLSLHWWEDILWIFGSVFLMQMGLCFGFGLFATGEASGIFILSSIIFWFSPVSFGKPLGNARWYCWVTVSFDKNWASNGVFYWCAIF
jgi:hypothetical protein